MKLTVLGATGGVGRHIVTHALADGHEVTAAVRDPARLPERHPKLAVLGTNALEAASVKEAVEGADAVLSGIGTADRHDPHKPASTSARATVQAMIATDVRRIIVVSAAPLNRSGAGQSLLTRRVFSPLLWAIFQEIYLDLELMERILRDSGLDWTSVRPPKLLNSPGQGRYRHAIEADPGGSTIPRADVARAMLDFLTIPETVGHAVGISR
ncbi:MAG TPA: SDR family oxidoreductase [Pseudonocardiaceae bacterium]|jgi:putative NADH-flavin reductase